MLEMKIKIEAADLAAAIAKLADAIAHADPPATENGETRVAMDVTPAVPQASSPAPVQDAPAPAAPISNTAAPISAHEAAPIPATQTAPTVTVAVPVATAPTYDIDQIATAGAALVNAGKMEQLLALLAKYGVAAVTQLKSEQYGGFVTELRALGAQI